MMSYNIPLSSTLPTPERVDELQSRLRELFPPAHLAWLRALPTQAEFGDYFFAHAGVKPGIPLNQQRKGDLLWIRDEFLHFSGTLDKVVVHGHTISEDVEVRPHRIGLDTGAYATGRLSALALEGENRRILETGLSS